MPAKDVQREATKALVASRTLKRAKSDLGVISRRVRSEDKQSWQWVWELPEDHGQFKPYKDRALRELGDDMAVAGGDAAMFRAAIVLVVTLAAAGLGLLDTRRVRKAFPLFPGARLPSVKLPTRILIHLRSDCHWWSRWPGAASKHGGDLKVLNITHLATTPPQRYNNCNPGDAAMYRLALFIILAAVQAQAQEKPLRVYFVGNSVTDTINYRAWPNWRRVGATSRSGAAT